jgi:hypothetical protein
MMESITTMYPGRSIDQKSILLKKDGSSTKQYIYDIDLVKNFHYGQEDILNRIDLDSAAGIEYELATRG